MKEGGWIAHSMYYLQKYSSFLDNNLDPLTVAALQTVSKRYRDYLQTTLVAAKKIHELKSRYRTKFDGCEDCFFVEAASDGQIEDVRTFLMQT